MLTNEKTCELAVHFNFIEHDISEISFIVIKKITSQGDAAYIDRLLGPFQTSNFTCAESNANERKQ